ncbi:hypothetical protein JMJ77_0007904 [Colletotrichum scovillei]|uniref:Uncharacterized protein n=1 Tax=Colletotrichum scovillei TaxID=1209932 RepID=A0A9P7RDV9_9PEZI|nr:hypothetical protein JMJ77_0007904 [Colletotrichum scovillei]KAG7074889.1 hypothetical protein JMJ76_0011357 [Colletotrichum scovillei]KAG7081987.1 hypothetical protein JMJ78_0004095 [Colletotrichum scovillei]
MASPKATAPCPELLGCAWATKRRNIRRIIWRSFFKRLSAIETVPGYLRRRRKGVCMPGCQLSRVDRSPACRSVAAVNGSMSASLVFLYWLLANQSVHDGASEQLMDLVRPRAG